MTTRPGVSALTRISSGGGYRAAPVPGRVILVPASSRAVHAYPEDAAEPQDVATDPG